MALTREEFLAKIDERRQEIETVTIPELDGDVCIRRLSAAAAERSGITAETVENDPALMARVIAACVTNEAAESLFTEDDVEALMEADVILTAKLFTECLRVNGLMSDELEEAVQSFENARSGASSGS